MFTLSSYLNPVTHPLHFKEDVVLKTETTSAVGCSDLMSKPIMDVFERPTSKFLANETYYVGAMYTSSFLGGTINYGTPSLSETPIFVAANEINELRPGDEIHCDDLHDHLF